MVMRCNEDGVSHGEASVSEEKTSVQQGDKGDKHYDRGIYLQTVGVLRKYE